VSNWGQTTFFFLLHIALCLSRPGKTWSVP